MKYNSSEKNTVKAMVFILLSAELLRHFFKLLPLGSFSPYVDGLIILSFAATVYFGKEKFFSFIFKYIPAVKNEEFKHDDWIINIKFTNAKGNQERVGKVKIINTINGYRLIGGELTDFNTSESTMNNWYSEASELIKFDNHSVLYYIYKIPGNNGKYEKIGFVYAVKDKDKNLYNGTFHDMKTDSNSAQALRTGTVQIRLSE